MTTLLLLSIITLTILAVLTARRLDDVTADYQQWREETDYQLDRLARRVVELEKGL